MTMLGITTAAGITMLCLSATANRQLLRQVGDDLHRFYAVPVEEFITKARHLSVLKDNATMLDGYYREGEPLRLGLGLYPANASASRYYAPFATGVRLNKKWR